MNVAERDYLDSRQLARFLNCTSRTIARYRSGSRGEPLPHSKGRQQFFYELAQVRSWVKKYCPKRQRAMRRAEEADRRARAAAEARMAAEPPESSSL